MNFVPFRALLLVNFRELREREVRILGILGNSDAASKGIHAAAEKEPGCVIR